ncbi:putative RING/U-box superfamily protein [Melia azedarach]|uniref:RING/U-box superfamily protein n=1 Tax=Melia azedarach TaxID=155640 RepID=A0ACC1Z2E0_MELAZ|nr:putative RING/U-box superfamily protein [Melia azedarach]
MSSSTNNFAPTSRNLRVGHDYGAYAPDNSDWNRRQAPFSRFGSSSWRADPDAGRGAHNPWQSFDPRGITGPFSLAGFPVHAHSPMQISILGNLRVRDIHPGQRQITQNLQNIHRTQEDDSRLTQDEQDTALKKLKKEVYNPTIKKLTRGLSLYYRDQARNVYREMEKQKENDTMRCAICLEDFEPKETVMLTPCNHMFHEDCIVPWVKSHAQCPVCRFSFGEKRRESTSDNNINIGNAAGDDLLARELVSVIRAMEEAFIWENAAR